MFCLDCAHISLNCVLYLWICLTFCFCLWIHLFMSSPAPPNLWSHSFMFGLSQIWAKKSASRPCRLVLIYNFVFFLSLSHSLQNFIPVLWNLILLRGYLALSTVCLVLSLPQWLTMDLQLSWGKEAMSSTMGWMVNILWYKYTVFLQDDSLV